MCIPVEQADGPAVELHCLRTDSSPLHLKTAFAKVALSPRKGQNNRFIIVIADHSTSVSPLGSIVPS